MDRIAELRELALNIERRREQLGLSKNAWCQKFGQLGSTKTYGRILNEKDDLGQLNLEAQCENYRAAWELVQAFDEDPEEMRVYSHFGFIEESMEAVAEALDQSDNTRLVLVTGDSGAGKSTVLNYMAECKETQKIFYGTEATEAWRQREGPLLGALLMEMGRFDGSDAPRHQRKANYQALPIGSNLRLEKLVDIIDGRRVIIGIDEGHHIGPAGYNIVKTIINQTRAVVVLTAMPELITRINKNSHAEAKQLFNNRLFRHVRIPPPSSGEVMDYMKLRGVKFTGPREASEIANKVSTDAKIYGLWKFVKRCAKEARKTAGSQKREHLGAEDFARIIGNVKKNISLG